MANMHGRGPDESTVDDSGSDVMDTLAPNHSLAAYESLVNTLPLSLLIKDTDGRRLFANETYLKTRGCSLDEVLGKRDEDLFPIDIARAYSKDDQHVIRTGESLHSVEESVDKFGRRRWIERIKSPVLDAHQHVIGIQLIFWDVTDRHLAERKLKHERYLLTTLLENIPDSIYFKDSDSRFVRISEAMAKKFGLARSADAIGKTDADIFTETHAAAARDDELRIMQTRQAVVDLVERETWPDRDDTWCMSTKMPLVEDGDKVIGTFGISRDITELIKYEEALRKARDEADSANRAKSEFLANMSHEIRTPMNAIIGMSELLAQTKLNNEQLDYINLVRDSAESLLLLLNEILDFSKIESRKLQLESIPFSLRDLIQRTSQSLSIRAAKKPIELACRVAPNLPDRWIGDPGRLRQVMINLIGNAIKFTDAGEVLVEVCAGARRDDVPPDHLPLRFSVKDTGIGIAKEKQASILDPFTQADESTTRRFGGTGLGLAISKELVHLMRGELQLESVPGEGTTFYFTAYFPLAADQSVPHEGDLESLAQLPVLVVDDNATNLRILQEICSNWRLSPTLADGGESALRAAAQAAEQGQPFQLAILDCMMPGMDGFELASQLRRDYSSDQMKLIMLSSASDGDALQRCQEVGIARYLTKPAVQSELLDTVLQVMQRKQIGVIDPRTDLPACLPMRVLVAEDGLANQHVAVGMLRASGHQPVVVSDGREAVARYRSEPFDMILMDMHMPIMDGIDATKAIRAHERVTGRHIPILALTAAAMKRDAEACEQCGMDGYLTKPIHQRRLQEMMARFAPETSVLDQPAPGVAVPGNAPAATAARNSDDRDVVVRDADVKDAGTPSGTSTEAFQVIDVQAVTRRIPGGAQGVAQLAEVFIKECTDLMQVLNDGIPGGDAVVIARTAHTLKGSAGLFYAEKVRELALQIETKAKAGDLADTVDDLARLNPQVDAMLAELHRLSHSN
ncbi:Signal transduction histidine-protein kinase BarA [Stieleria maiorica]|uniref:Sensory/regulatory protein RpfC n=1 Tax=Stieleria maiorica TaxID=2795974 RepID=A0A5B9MRK7_9BACT|nr:response regulator [Stieleria maiorica]QEG02436.1 Signal transduction histidine-protein kinase BarA [Stieleria maiorica]